MLNQTLHTIQMAIPQAWQGAYSAGEVAVNNGVLRHVAGLQAGQIAAHLIPVSQTTVRGALLVPVLATQFATIGAVAVAFVVINKKLNAIREAIAKLESKFDDKQWSLIEGAISDLCRIEEAGRKSRIWEDIGGVRQRLSDCSAYHWRRLSGQFDSLDTEWRSVNYSAYPALAKEAVGDLSAFSVSSFSVARTLLMDGEYDLAFEEASTARGQIEEAMEMLAKSQLSYLVKKNAPYTYSSEHLRLVAHVEELVETHKPVDALYRSMSRCLAILNGSTMACHLVFADSGRTTPSRIVRNSCFAFPPRHESARDHTKCASSIAFRPRSICRMCRKLWHEQWSNTIEENRS